MNEGYDDDSSDKYLKWSNTKSNLSSTDDASAELNNNEAKNSSIAYIVSNFMSTFLPSSVSKLYSELIKFYHSEFLNQKEPKTKRTLRNKLSEVFKNIMVAKMSLSHLFFKFICVSGVFTIGLLIVICMINVTNSSPEIDDNRSNLGNDRYVHRNSRKYKSFESNARTSEELLNDITSYGLERSRFLYEIKEKRIYEHGIALTKSDPAHFVAVFNKQTPRAKELSRYGYATLEASSLITKQFMLTRQQVVYGLERVELRSTDLFGQCPFRAAPTPGDENFVSKKRKLARQFDSSSNDINNNGVAGNNDSKDDADVLQSNGQFPDKVPGYCVGLDLIYRSADGSCNNMKQLEWGSAFLPFLRFLPPDYSDGVQAFRVSRSGKPLPNPRSISTKVHKETRDETVQFTMMVMQWGQFVDHDLTSTPQTRGFNRSLIRCCSEGGKMLDNPDEFLHPDCAPIEIPPTDRFYSQFNATCMEFVRSSPASRSDCSLGPRDQINQITSYLDASNIYGSTKDEQDSLRLGRFGKLKYTDLHIRKPLLPALDHRIADEECRISTKNLHCFASGDSRCNEQPALAAMHTLWLREHNRIARRLSRLNQHWSDDRVFYETRKIVGAMLQHITYNEWLPIILGPRVLEIFELKLMATGFYNGYNDTVNPTISNAFAAAAFRFGHSLVKNTISRCSKQFSEVPFFIKLHKELNNPANLHNFGSVDRLMFGLIHQKIARRDEFIASELTNHLFQTPRSRFGMDLASLNIQRGRDHGLAAYNIWREQCGLRRFQKWTDMTDVMTKGTIQRLSSAYDHVDDIDLFTGGISERPVVGGVVGPTFACILGQQFLNLRKGDRFWYENGGVDAKYPGGFTSPQLQEIRKSSLSRVICNGLDDVGAIQPYAFLADDDFSNRRSACKGSRIPRVDLNKWKEDEINSQPTLFSAAPTLYSVLSLPSSQNEFGLHTNSANDTTNASASNYSTLNFIHEQLHSHDPNASSSKTVEQDKNFAEWLKNKELTQNSALNKIPSKIQTDEEEAYLEEVPKPISSEQYFSVFKGDNNDIEANNSNDNDIPFDFILKGRSSKSKNDFRETKNRDFDNFVDDLFKAARKTAFEEKQLFY